MLLLRLGELTQTLSLSIQLTPPNPTPPHPHKQASPRVQDSQQRRVSLEGLLLIEGAGFRATAEAGLPF